MKAFKLTIDKILNVLSFERLLINFKSRYVGYGEANQSDECLKYDYLPLLVDYHSLIPDLNDIETRNVWSKKSQMVGVNLNAINLRKLEKEVQERYGGDLIRCLVDRYQIKKITTFKKGTDISIFKHLSEADLLVIETSHYVKMGGDVNEIFLEVLPRLKKGAIICFREISLPYEYPKEYAVSQLNRRFFTEQYLLWAFLINNHVFEVIYAESFIRKDQQPGDFVIRKIK